MAGLLIAALAVAALYLAIEAAHDREGHDDA